MARIGKHDAERIKTEARVGGAGVRCACCRTLGEKRFCKDCSKRLLCESCGKCSGHCLCDRQPRCANCAG